MSRKIASSKVGAHALPVIYLSMNLKHQDLWRGLMLAALLLLIPASAAAQGGSIRGNVVLPDGSFLNERARITLQTSRGIKSSVYTDNQGAFNSTRLRQQFTK